jgi:nitrile hydratase beta subunit
MNGVHDMGGMQDMGAVQREKNEPVFHERWEGRVWGMMWLGSAWGKWNLDAMRHAIERIPPTDYLRMSYYEKWLAALVDLVVGRGLVTRGELESGKPAAGSAKATPPVKAEGVPALIARANPVKRDVAVAARFQVGQRVRGRNINPVTHTRLPRYARGKLGTIERDHGVFLLADSNAHFQGEKPQHLYSVRFTARELWGEQAAPRDAVYVNLWDDHLEPA